MKYRDGRIKKYTNKICKGELIASTIHPYASILLNIMVMLIQTNNFPYAKILIPMMLY